MNDVHKEKICKILMKEYRKHNEQVCEKHQISGYFLYSWSQKMRSVGIEMFQKEESKIGYVVVATGLFMGHVHIPEETAEKILVLGSIP